MKSVRDIAREFMGRGGKRLRPRLCRIVYEALLAESSGKCEPGGDFEKVLEAVECFHKASLIHDDIQDGDCERYGKPSVHAEHGIPMAIAVGDWLVAEGYRLLATSGFPRAADMLAAASESHLQLSEGQGDELAIRLAARRATEDETLSIYRRKTGEAFALAARLGAVAALAPGERSQRVERELVRFGLAFGILFQMRDDEADGEAALSPACRDAAQVECAAAASSAGSQALASALAAFSDALAPNGGLVPQSGIEGAAKLL